MSPKSALRCHTRHSMAVLALIVCTIGCFISSTISSNTNNNNQRTNHVQSTYRAKRFVQDDTTTAIPPVIDTLEAGVSTTQAPPTTIEAIVEPLREAVITSELPSPTTTTTTTTTSTTHAPVVVSEHVVANDESADLLNGGEKPIPAINYTDVEIAFTSVMNEDDVRKRWLKMDASIKKGVQDVIKMVFPHIASMASDARVSGNCSGGMLKWMLNLRNLRSWAIKMLDAIGKPGAGLLEGQLTMFGNYRQCLDVRAPDEDEIELFEVYKEFFRGKYCVLQLRPNLPQKPRFYGLNSTIESLKRTGYKYYERTIYDELADLAMAFNFVSLRMDLCVPSLCTQDDIQRVANFLSSKLEMRAKVLRCEQTPSEEDTTPMLDSTQLTWALAIGSMILVVVLATAVSLALNYLTRDKSTHHKSNHHQSKHPQPTAQSAVLGNKHHDANAIGDQHSTTRASNKLIPIVGSMSIVTSMDELSLATATARSDASLLGDDCCSGGAGENSLDAGEPPTPVALYGVRALLIFWCCLVTSSVGLNFQFLRQLLPLRDLIMEWPMQLIVNSQWQFESLIVLTAFTFAYKSTSDVSSVKQLFRMAVDRFAQLTPAILFLVGLTIITPVLYQGHSPVWADFVTEPARVCSANGIWNIMFLQNYLPYTKICLPQTWLFCVELQLIILSIPLVHWLNRRYERSGTVSLSSAPVVVTIGLIVFGALISALNVFSHELPPAWFATLPDQEDKSRYFGGHLFLTHTHLSSFFIGLLAGHITRVSVLTHTFNLLSSPTHNGLRSSSKSTSQAFTHLALSTGAIVLMISIVFMAHSWSIATLPDALTSAIYDSLGRLVWCASFAILLWQIVSTPRTSQGLIIGSLSHPLSVVAGQLSLLVYLLHPYVHSTVLALQEQPIFSSLVVLFHTFIGNQVLTFALAYLISVLIEQPYRRLVSKHLIGSRHCTRRLNICSANSLYPMTERTRGSITAGIGNIANMTNTLPANSTASHLNLTSSGKY